MGMKQKKASQKLKKQPFDNHRFRLFIRWSPKDYFLHSTVRSSVEIFSIIELISGSFFNQLCR